MSKTVIGRQKKWQLLEAVGRGDAGEVLHVQSENMLEDGVMKRPVQNVSGGTIVRQATQIENEGNILKELDGLDYRRGSLIVHTPIFFDESIPGTSGTANLFIVSEQVKGKSIDSLLKEFQQGQGQFSQVLVIKVLVGLFNLLPRVHEKGILWNDVKMEHIFWDDTKGMLSFIDWGNGLRFDPSNSGDSNNPSSDYQQLISEGNLFLELTQSGFSQEIGWPREGGNLTDQEITQLRFRLEFMQSHLEMRATEYSLYVNQLLENLTDARQLQEVFDLGDSLEKLGVSIDPNQIIHAVSSLINELISQNQYETIERLIEMVTVKFQGNQEEDWRLLRYCLSIPELTNNRLFHEMAKAMASKDWATAIWTTQQIQETPDFPYDLTKLIVAMRSHVKLPNATTLPVSEILLLLNKRASNPDSLSQDPAIRERLQRYQSSLVLLSENWPLLRPSQHVGDQFLQARDLLSDPAASFLGFSRDQLVGVNLLITVTRDLYRGWETGELEHCLDTLHQLFSLEPTAIYLHEMAEDVIRLIDWIHQISSDPAPHLTATQHANALAEQPLPIIRWLGQPEWLLNYRNIVDRIAHAEDLVTVRQTALAENWPTPWLHYQTTQLNLPLIAANVTQLNHEQVEVLNLFHQALHHGKPPKYELEGIREVLPGFHHGYQLISQTMQTVFSPLDSMLERWPEEAFPVVDRPNIVEFYALINHVEGWKQRVQAGVHDVTQLEHPASEWKVLLDMQLAEKDWFDQLLPLLSRIRQKQWATLVLPQGSIDPEHLKIVVTSLSILAKEWEKVSTQGVFPESVQELIELIDRAQLHFFACWQNLQAHESEPLRWLVLTFQSSFSQINQSLWQISRHFRSVSRALTVLNTPQMARTKLAQNSASDLIYALLQLEELLQPQTRKRSAIREWQKQYLELLAEPNREHLLSKIVNVDSIHPLLPWFNELVRRDTDFFNASDW